MKTVIIATAVVALILSPAAFAQSSTNTQSPTASQSSSASGSNSGQNIAATQQIQKDLQNAGFTDVRVVAQSFVVQAKSKDGDPVLMTIGPRGMSVFEGMNAAASGSTGSNKTTGSDNQSSSSSK